jgi:catechol 2,3-dioxygenase-like lactoylglutathione lyase family enzyme
MEAFLTDFGLQRVDRSANRLYMRAFGPAPFVHFTELGPAGGIGFALQVESSEQLHEIAQAQGAQVDARDEPGGGHVVRLKDPDGNALEIVHGFAREQPPSRKPFAFNAIEDRARLNVHVRSQMQPSHVRRLGHVALHTGRFPEMRAFYMNVLGMRISDSYHAGSVDNELASFLHCGLNERFVDHHTVAIIGIGRTGFDHSAFEVTDLDDLMSGNAYLVSRQRWKHSWGIGRHFEGSQLFDYWRDPFGNKIEHWSDGDLVNDNYPSKSVEFDPQNGLSQWGPPLTPDFLS